jgi:hypothetical protein
MGFFYAFAQKQDIAYVIAIYTPSINPKYALAYFAPRVMTINVTLWELTKIKDFIRVNPDKEIH